MLTAIAAGATPAELAALLITAQTDRYYADRGPQPRFHQQGDGVPRYHRLATRRGHPAHGAQDHGGGARRGGGERLAPPARSGAPSWRRPSPGCPGFSGRGRRRRASGGITARWPGPSSARRQSPSSPPWAPRSPPAPGRRTSPARSPMRRRSAWRASAPRTSFPTGTRRFTPSPTPTHCIRL